MEINFIIYNKAMKKNEHSWKQEVSQKENHLQECFEELEKVNFYLPFS